MTLLDSIGPRLTAKAIVCPSCHAPTNEVDRDGRIFLADGFDLGAIPERVDFSPHTCPGYLDHVTQLRRVPR
jgi:hypothetical protein